MFCHIIYNYQQLDDARIQQEISRNLYAQAFGGVYVVHSYNGKKSFGYRKYLEDKFIHIKNRGHFQGAVDLINVAVSHLNSLFRAQLKYVLVTAADTWLLNVNFLRKLIEEMEKTGKVLAISSWATKMKGVKRPVGFSIDFFVIDLQWNKDSRIFPLNYKDFREKFFETYALNYTILYPEDAFQYAYHKYFLENHSGNEIITYRDSLLRRIIEREPIHNQKGVRKESWPSIGLYTSNDPSIKKKALESRHLDIGHYSHKLVTSLSLDYYNAI